MTCELTPIILTSTRENLTVVGVDQPAHTRSLISAFVIRHIESIIINFCMQNFNILVSNLFKAAYSVTMNIFRKKIFSF